MEPTIRLPIRNYTNNKEHYDTHKLFKESDNEYTVVHFAKNSNIGLDTADVSIFKESEWYKIKVIVNELCEICHWSIESDMYEIPIYKPDTQIRNEEYLLTNSQQIDILKGFKDFSVDLFQNPQDIYDYLYEKKTQKTQKTQTNHNTISPNTTINKFRQWLSENYESIIKHYEYVMNVAI